LKSIFAPSVPPNKRFGEAVCCWTFVRQNRWIAVLLQTPAAQSERHFAEAAPVQANTCNETMRV
jgi:hypothetical protein